MFIFADGDPVDPQKINSNFAEVDSKLFTLNKQLSAGTVVRLINDAGDPEVTDLLEACELSVGTEQTFPSSPYDNNGSIEQRTAYDPINKIFVMLFMTSSSVNAVRAGKLLPNGTILWGNPTNVQGDSASIYQPSIAYLPTSRNFVVQYRNSSYGYIALLTVNGDLSITKSADTQIGYMCTATIIELSATSILLVGQGGNGSSTNLAGRRVILSNGAFTASAEVYANDEALYGNNMRVAFDPATWKFYIFMAYNGWKVIRSGQVDKVSYAVSFNNNRQQESGSSDSRRILWLGGAPYIFYRKAGVGLGWQKITDTNDVLSFGTETMALGNVADRYDVNYVNDKVLVNYKATADSSGVLKVGTFANNAFTWSDPITLHASKGYNLPVYVSDQAKYIFYSGLEASYYKHIVVRLAGNYATKIAEAFGILQENGNVGESKRVVTSGALSKVHVGHTINAKAYLDPVTGEITETASDYEVGVFTSDTDLLFDIKTKVLNVSQYVQIIPQTKSLSGTGWQDWDLSQICPQAKLVEISLFNYSSTQNLGVRQNGSSESNYVSVNNYESMAVRVAPDANGVIEVYPGSNTSCKFTVTGYWK